MRHNHPSRTAPRLVSTEERIAERRAELARAHRQSTLGTIAAGLLLLLVAVAAVAFWGLILALLFAATKFLLGNA